MTLQEFEKEYMSLPDEKTATLDRFCRKLIREHADVSFLREEYIRTGKYFYIYQYVSVMEKETLEEKFAFIESTFPLMNDWVHTDCIMKFLGSALSFDDAYRKAEKYVYSEYPYARRLGYVIFIPRLTKEKENIEKLTKLLKNDEQYHVIMAEAWLISFLAMCDVQQTYAYLKTCDLKYNIVGKAIQKICDSYVIAEEDKVLFKSLREERRKIR